MTLQPLLSTGGHFFAGSCAFGWAKKACNRRGLKRLSCHSVKVSCSRLASASAPASNRAKRRVRSSSGCALPVAEKGKARAMPVPWLPCLNLATSLFDLPSVVDLPSNCGRGCACCQEVWRTFTKKQHNSDGPGRLRLERQLISLALRAFGRLPGCLVPFGPNVAPLRGLTTRADGSSEGARSRVGTHRANFTSRTWWLGFDR